MADANTNDLESQLRQPSQGAAWIALVMTVGSWIGWVWLAIGEDARSGLDQSEPWIRAGGWIVPFGLGFLAILLRADASGTMGEALRRQYLLLAAPLAGPLAGLLFTFWALTGRFGGGTTVYGRGAHVVHHDAVEDGPIADRVFGALLFGGTTIAAPVVWYFIFRAFGVDLVSKIGSDFG